MIDRAGWSRWFSKMDLHAGFHHIRVHEAHVERTAFKTKYGTYQFKVMPFGLCTSTSYFSDDDGLSVAGLKGYGWSVCGYFFDRY